MHRIFGQDTNVDGELFIIPEDDQFHLDKVLRFKKGEVFEAVVGNKIYELIYINSETAKIISHSKIQIDTKPNINLFFAILKGDKTDFVLQKCTEIGVTNFYPMITMRTIPDIRGKEFDKVGRWQRIVNDASKQSKGKYIPKVHYPIEISEVFNHIYRNDFSIVPYEEEKTTTIKEALDKYRGGDINIIIGPEGGFELIEIMTLNKVGVKSVSLGEKILRAETAAMVALSNVIYELEL
ncbi:MAG: 16S rRNA (uracil(1498)-N(3))-methyltransferase [Tissierellia bacterium]|jgi:16S rRNA (uracil1498-N3)-methyltransferase|nr:16S rRNA (uracil(1498)-N(3))-methyltransferase [Tissierellia bacterium]